MGESPKIPPNPILFIALLNQEVKIVISLDFFLVILRDYWQRRGREKASRG